MLASSRSSGPSAVSSSRAAAVRAADVAAASPHALVNLVRLVKGLEARAPESPTIGDSPVLDMKKRDLEVQRDKQTLLYAQALLNALNGQNEQSSGTSQTLAQLTDTLRTLESAYNSYNPSTELAIPSAPLSRVQSRISTTTKHNDSNVKAVQSHPVATYPASAETARPALRRRRARTGPILAAYLAKREKEDAQGGEAGLLPVSTSLGGQGTNKEGVDAEKQREQLLAGNTSMAALSGAQLHEELGGQLAQMSNQLKRNALHFANSLEEEKAILETSQMALEGNLEKTQSSKTQLSAVTRSGRGTTCMSIGIVLLVLIIFVWTYMLIRFT